MAYRRLIERLEEGARNEVVCLPDGSVDRYYRVFEGRDHRIAARDAFGERIATGRADSFRLDPVAREPGGQAVNAAHQANALGDRVALFGHLDRLSVPFEATSMGDPARVHVLVFEDDELVVAEPSEDLLAWTVEDLREEPGATAALESADAVVCGNWVSLPGMDELLATLPDLVPSSCAVVFDPGGLTGSHPDALRDLLESLRALAGEHRSVLSANAAETNALLDGTGVAAGETADRLADLRDRTGLDAVVLHRKGRALGATPEGQVAVPNLNQRTVRRRTGAGDRFDAGLAHALAAGWDWEVALALGNACASYFVANAETASTDDVLATLEGDSLPG